MRTPFKMAGFSGFGNSPIKSEKRIAEIRKKLKEGVGADGYDMSEKEHQSLVLELKKFMMQEEKAKKTKSPAEDIKKPE